MQQLKLVWKNEYFQTGIMIFLIVALVLGFWYGSRWVLNSDYPMLAVASGSMSLPKRTPDDGWSKPFSPTLHTGDLIIVEGFRNASEDVYVAPLNESGRSGDILVFRAPGSDELIVHRAVGKIVENGRVEFITQGDNNDVPGPYSPTPAEDVIGKVVMRIPWVGHIALYMRNSTGILLIAILVIVIIAIESVLSGMSHKRSEDSQNVRPESALLCESRLPGKTKASTCSKEPWALWLRLAF
jgi:signal peptidase I